MYGASGVNFSTAGVFLYRSIIDIVIGLFALMRALYGYSRARCKGGWERSFHLHRIHRHVSTSINNIPQIENALLERARKLTKEFERLNKEAENDTEFTNETAARQKKLTDLEPVYDTFGKWQNTMAVRSSSVPRYLI